MTDDAALRNRWGAFRSRVGSLVFGDWRGVVLFLGALVLLGVLTRVGIFITDTYTVANAFAALTDGHLAVRTPVYGGGLDTPGMQRIDGAWYGRNYGQIVASLPAYWALSGLSVVADLRIALVGAWSLLVLALCVQFGRLVDRARPFAIGGAGVAVALFLANAAVATPLDDRLRYILALQLTAILAGALVVVVVYRLLELFTSPRLGAIGGLLTLFATPIGFWAPIPKRHVFTTLLVLVSLFALARSREEGAPGSLHGAAYASVGLLTWLHSPEALVLFLAVLLTDLVTLSSVSRHRVGIVAGAFLLSLVPFFVTNTLVSGDPLLAPRLLGRVDAAMIGVPTASTHSGGGPLVAAAGSGVVTALAVPVLDEALAALEILVDLLGTGVATVWYHPEQVYHTFLRSGYIARTAPTTEEAINLSIVESAPLLGAVASLPAVALVRLRSGSRRPRLDSLRSPAGAAGLSLALFALLLTLVYISRLPLHAQVTVRYLLPVFAVGTVAVVWLSPASRVLAERSRLFGWTLAACLLVGSQLLIVAVVALDLAIGEAFQFHALLGLGLAVLLACWSLLATVTDRLDAVGAVVLALAAAAAAIFSLFVVTAYAGGIGRYPIGGDQLLPIVRLLADAVSTV